VFDVPLPVLVGDQAFRVAGSHESKNGMLTVEFTVGDGQAGAPQLMGLVRGSFTCDPLKNWAVQSYEIERRRETADSPTYHVIEAASYGPASAEFVNLTHTIYRTYWEADGVKFDNTWESEIQASKCELPPEAFTLSAFGLPEPVLRAERIRFWLWINALAIGLIVLAFWLRNRAPMPKRR
jgi:hypothetical protein